MKSVLSDRRSFVIPKLKNMRICKRCILNIYAIFLVSVEGVEEIMFAGETGAVALNPKEYVEGYSMYLK